MNDETLKYQQVGWTLLDRRLELGITREALSEQLSIDAEVIDQIEAGDSADLLVHVVAIAIELKIDLETLFDQDKDARIVGNVSNSVLKAYR